MDKILLLAAGGAAGAVLRYGVSGITHKFMGEGFPWGTLCVNILGAFALGALSGAAEKFVISHNVRILLFIGLLGAFTTFSAYSLESLDLLRSGQARLALTNIFFNNAACIGAVFLGFVAAKYSIG
ncbi:MAG: fluoride efflux transporter CrcB [Candidatus Omnitrophica bacterium]|nr:fluoride efflux transporter CrcB [Candidatus Omnitrophota bacterium]